MRKFLVIAAALLVPAVANADTLQNSIGNTVVVRAADGSEVMQVRLSADGTYTQRNADGSTISGVWRNGNGQLCATPQGAAEACYSVPMDKSVGDTWSAVDASGAAITTSIVAGQ